MFRNIYQPVTLNDWHTAPSGKCYHTYGIFREFSFKASVYTRNDRLNLMKFPY